VVISGHRPEAAAVDDLENGGAFAADVATPEGRVAKLGQVSSLLGLAQMLEPDHRHVGEPQLPCREQPAVAGQDAALLVDQDRVGPAELDHRGCDLVHLLVAVRARVALVRTQLVDRPQLDPVDERD